MHKLGVLAGDDTTPPKLDALTRPSLESDQDGILKFDEPPEEELKWHGHGSTTETYYRTITVRIYL